MLTLKSGIIGIISFLAVVGFSTPATTYAWVGGDMNFSNIGNIYLSGYTVSGMNPMQGGQYGMPTQQRGTTANTSGSWGWTSSTYPARAFDPMHDTFPPYPQQSYGAGYSGGYSGGYTNGYSDYGYSNYSNNGSYPQMMYDPYYGTSAAFGPSYPTGDYDLIGTPLCQWYDYNGRTPCAYDPHQWVYDQYTGSWY